MKLAYRKKEIGTMLKAELIEVIYDLAKSKNNHSKFSIIKEVVENKDADK